jgi:hypothetical protein
MTMPFCKTCRQPIVFVTMSTGAKMPLDPDPFVGGNIFVDEHGIGHVTPDRERPHFASHFSTCKQAALHRKKKAAP